MHTIDYIKQNGIEALAELGISVKNYPDDGLYVLNYDQIHSPDTHPVVMECRGLILDHGFNVVSRSMDRFFNFSQHPETQEHLDWSKAVVMDKHDGSLIKIYFWNGLWRVSTRGTAFAESNCNGFDVTFYNLVLEALGCNEKSFQKLCNTWLDNEYTFIGEITCVENRVVKRYNGYSLWFIACRENLTGDYLDYNGTALGGFGFRQIQTYKFDSVEACIETAKHLKDLDEGYVVWQDGVPICKIKSPAYVAVHHIRLNVSSLRAFIRIALLGEKDEICLYFPEYEKEIDNCLVAWVSLSKEIDGIYKGIASIENQKDFAIELLKKTQLLSGIAFTARKLSTTTDKILLGMDIERKIRLLEEYMNID